MSKQQGTGHARVQGWLVWIIAFSLWLIPTTLSKAAPLPQASSSVAGLVGALQVDPLDRARKQLVTANGITYDVVGSTSGLDEQVQALTKRLVPVRVKVWGYWVSAADSAQPPQLTITSLVVLDGANTTPPLPIPTPTPTALPVPTVLPTPSPPSPLPTTLPSAAANITWQATYFANPNLAGPPVFTAQLPAINFDWGTGSPAPAVPVDHFSARFEQTVNLPAGFYAMRAQADDGIRVYMNNALIIGEWHLGQPPVYRAGRQLAGPTTFRVEYYEAGGKASVRFAYDLVDNFPEWKVAYYNNIALQGEPSWLEADIRSSAGAINHQWSLNSPVAGVVPVDNWSARWTGTFNFETGDYTFWAEAIDGVRLWVDGHPVLDAWHDHSGKTQNIFYGIGAGPHQVTVEYYARGGIAGLKVDWYKQAATVNALVAGRTLAH